MRQLQKKLKSGNVAINKDDPFELFISSTNIRYCYYSETFKILGNTFGMLILQVNLTSSISYYEAVVNAYPIKRCLNLIIDDGGLTCYDC